MVLADVGTLHSCLLTLAPYAAAKALTMLEQKSATLPEPDGSCCVASDTATQQCLDASAVCLQLLKTVMMW